MHMCGSSVEAASESIEPVSGLHSQYHPAAVCTGCALAAAVACFQLFHLHCLDCSTPVIHFYQTN